MNHLGLALCLFGISSVLLIGDVSALSVRIIGGDYSVKGQFPYLVSIQTNGQHLCGGSIVADQYILTAAHCLIDERNTALNRAYSVVFDSIDLNNYDEGFEVEVEAAYAHRKYNPRSGLLLNDIAILKLKQRIPVGGNSGLQKVSLPRFGDSYAGRTAVISGYGYTSIEVKLDPTTMRKIEGRGSSDHKLKYAYVDLISNSNCMEKNNYLIYPEQICGQVKQQDRLHQGICSGDSGGPLVVDDVQVGVVSSSPTGCDEFKMAATYTRVSQFLSFIDTVINEEWSSEVRYIPIIH